jgi:tRNA threonylcarbamoyladenosine biosynthesis protein TsaB
MDGVTVAIDASTYEGSVAVMIDGRVAAAQTALMRGETEERLMPAVAGVLASANCTPGDIRRVVCGSGPGSFTSLRIAASIAKGLAMAIDAPLYAVSSLALAAVEAGVGRWVVAIDAMRGEVFAAGFEWTGTELRELRASTLVPRSELDSITGSLGATLLDARPHACAAGALLARILSAGPVDLAPWEPNYGRLAEAQVRWEAAHGQTLGT